MEIKRIQKRLKSPLGVGQTWQTEKNRNILIDWTKKWSYWKFSDNPKYIRYQKNNGINWNTVIKMLGKINFVENDTHSNSISKQIGLSCDL